VGLVVSEWEPNRGSLPQFALSRSSKRRNPGGSAVGVAAYTARARIMRTRTNRREGSHQATPSKNPGDDLIGDSRFGSATRPPRLVYERLLSTPNTQEVNMHRAIPAALVAGVLLIGCARQSRVESGGEVDLSATPVDARTLPSGTSVEVTLDQEIGTKVSKVGDTFTATVANAIVAQNGATVVPAGAKVYGKVTGVDNSDRVGDAAVIKVDFERIAVAGQDHPFNAKVTATNLQTRGGDTRNETLKKAGIGAAAGAVLGAVLSGGDLDKILLGGALGAAAGTAISLGMGDTEAVLPAGTRMTLQTTQMVTLR
jgi:hypothetical protein